MTPALLLVDMQADFLARSGLTPPTLEMVARAAELLNGCRHLGVPVIHIHTLVHSDGADRMPHWQAQDIRLCVAGTPGAEAPPALRPISERVFAKQFYSGFGNPDLIAELQNLRIDTLIIGGVYLESCVRSTVLDAYQAGYRVWIAEDVVATADPLHASVSRNYLSARAATFIPFRQILQKLGLAKVPDHSDVTVVPVAEISGWRLPATHQVLWAHHSPADSQQVLNWVPIAEADEVEAAVAAARVAQPLWDAVPLPERIKVLQAWAQILARRKAELSGLLTQEIGKPLNFADDEIARGLAHIVATVSGAAAIERRVRVGRALVRHCPVGVVVQITPWNNPIAIPVGKLAPALLCGNGVVWKPALQAPRSALLLMETLSEAGVPQGVVNLVFGDANTVNILVTSSGVDAVSVTGSTRTGIGVAMACAAQAKPVQAEMGGNNAAIITSRCDLTRVVPLLVKAAFGYSGQRCTATRRWIVELAVLDDFRAAMVTAIRALRIGVAGDTVVDIGPLISREHQQRVRHAVEEAVAAGARLICGGEVPKGWEQGCWYAPTLLETDSMNAHIVTEETFGPVAVIQPAANFDEALALCNAVEQGLLATLYDDNPENIERFMVEAQAGMLRINATNLELDPAAPFGGWKSSHMGPPEHGEGDWTFYLRGQTLYGQDLL